MNDIELKTPLLDIKESCAKCTSLDKCVAYIEENINSMLLGRRQNSVRCIHFGHLEDCIIDAVAKEFVKAARTYYIGIDDKENEL